MSINDQTRWDDKWQNFGTEFFPPHALLVENKSLLVGGQALDLACGRGQNAFWLARHGYKVLGVDISAVALAQANRESNRLALSTSLHFIQADLDHWRSAEEKFDLICVFRFLDRDLFPVIRKALLPGGLLFFSTRNQGFLAQDPLANTDYLLKTGELAAVFADWHILLDRENVADADFIARKPLGVTT